MPRNSTVPQKKSTQTVSGGDKSIVVGGDISNSTIVSGDVTVHQNFFQRIFITLFKPDAETLDQRNRRILLGHVENFWVKGVLEKSLHGAAMLELGIKEDPTAVTYPWAIKKEETGETLPAGTSMLEIFEQIGMGRSLLILGAPGSGKTTMLLELARQLIERARQNADEPIPMVFNLASWTEKLSLADWLTQELNNLYNVPRKTAPDWIKGNKLLLLLDGLDEVRQESRTKCVDAINQFRKEHGLTSLAVCSRSLDYGEIEAKLAFEGAIEVQPLTQKQVSEFFNRLGKEMAGLKGVLKKDGALREMAETPLFLSIMIMVYRSQDDVDIFISQDVKAQRKQLFDTYIERMVERRQSTDITFNNQNIKNWLFCLANKMLENNQTSFFIENIQPSWLHNTGLLSSYRRNSYFIFGLVFGLMSGIDFGLFCWQFGKIFFGQIGGTIFGWFCGLLIGLIIGSFYGKHLGQNDNIRPGSTLIWKSMIILQYLIVSVVIVAFGLISWFVFGTSLMLILGITTGLITGAIGLLFFIGIVIVLDGLLGQLLCILHAWDFQSGIFFAQHYILRSVMAKANTLPWKLVPFLDYCTDLIFLRRVGGGYIFVHRLLMEHFAAMYKEVG